MGVDREQDWGIPRWVWNCKFCRIYLTYLRSSSMANSILFDGQILFYESRDAVKALQDKIPLYADKFPEWSEHTSAMHQFAAWTALEAEGLGANLQHYNPLPDQKAAQIWDIPADWQLKAQLVFGGLQEGAREKLADKASEPIAGGRLFVHGKSA